MKAYLIFPPQWTPFAPPLGIPLLTAYLRKSGFNVSQKDANVEFYNYILSKDFIAEVKNKVNTFMSNCENLIGDSGDVNLLPEKNKLRYQVIKDIFKDLEPWWENLESNTERAIKILKSREMFYQPLLLAEATFHLRYALQACGLEFFPSEVLLNFFGNVNYKLTIDSLLAAANDVDGNIFLNYYNNKLLKEIEKENPDFIGISINCNTQVVAGLTLAKKIKELYPQIHVNIGGNFFTRTLDVVKEKPQLFENLIDSIIYGAGEISSEKLLKALKNKSDLSEVPGIAYLKDGQVVITDPEIIDINDLPAPDFRGLDLKQYLSPEIIFPLQTSRGCYWEKCTFCDHYFGSKYAVKSTSKLIEEIKELNSKYSAKNFYFVDEAISPNYMKNMAQKIIVEKLNISWYTCARAEKGFTKEVCEISSLAGLKMLIWGLESGSERILNLINKGIEKETAIEVIKNASSKGIWNHAFIFFGFPSEDLFEAMESVNLLVENKDNINSYGMGTFTLGKYSKIHEQPKEFFIDYIAPIEEELETATENFTTTKGMTREEVRNFNIYNTEYCAGEYEYPLWMSIGGYKDHMFLYLDKYGPKVLSYTPDETVQMFGSF